MIVEENKDSGFILDPLTSNDVTTYPYYYKDNVLTDEEIRHLINSVEYNPGRLEKAKIQTNGGQYDPHYRRSEICWIDRSDKSIDFFSKKIAKTFREVNQDFFRYSLYGLEATQFTKYIEDDNSYYNWHVDEAATGYKSGLTRKLSSVLFLSDPGDYEGGELQICINPNDIVTVEPKKGRMVFFPSFTTHKVNPVTSGVRYTAVSWARGPAFV